MQGILFSLGVIFCTLFLNIDLFPFKIQMGAGAEEPANKPVFSEPLFQVTTNPDIPKFILQGNYVIHGSSLNNRYTAYLYPEEWETIGDIYIKDAKENSWTKLQLDQECRVKMWDSYAPKDKYTPKKQIIWLNNEEFITIIGFAYGTISKGGELVKVNRVTGEGKILYPAYQKPNQEVVDFEQMGQELVLKINITDANGLCLEKGEARAPLNDLKFTF